MESSEHLAISAIVAPIVVAGLYGVSNPVNFLILTVYGVAAGVLIDLDHFVWARYNHGHWEHLLEAFEKPFTVMRDNQAVMENALEENQRYISHLFIFAMAGALTYTVSQNFMILTTSMVGIHILSDLYRSFEEGELPI